VARGARRRDGERALPREPLSDFIGFMAAKNTAKSAAAHLLHHMSNIAKVVPLDTGVIPLILDGENAWETFPDGGEGFCASSTAAWKSARTCSIPARPRITSAIIRRANTSRRCTPARGSAATSISGSATRRKNRAWDLLGEARTFLQGRLESGSLSAEQRCGALREIYAAEGSDWFWWYGPDFSTDNDLLFDRLFRQHLRNVYTLCGELPPSALDWPIAKVPHVQLYDLPTALISPKIDGHHETYFEWNGAGRYVTGADHGGLRHRGLINEIRFGHDDETLFLPYRSAPLGALRHPDRLPAPHRRGPADRRHRSSRPAGFHADPARGQNAAARHHGRARHHRNRRELCRPRLPRDGEVSFRVKAVEDGLEVERHPEKRPHRVPSPRRGDGAAQLDRLALPHRLLKNQHIFVAVRGHRC